VKVTPAAKTAATDSLNKAFGIPVGGGGGGGAARRAALANLTPEQRTAYDKGVADIEAKWPTASMKDFGDHIDHAVKVAGIDHVGISSDFDGGGGITGWRDAGETMNVTVELLRRGYTEQQIEKLWSGNTLRVWAENARIAKQLQSMTP
jgi:membrane dipeptidase